MHKYFTLSPVLASDKSPESSLSIRYLSEYKWIGSISLHSLFVKYICIRLILLNHQPLIIFWETVVQLLLFRISLSSFLIIKYIVQLFQFRIYLSSFLNSISCLAAPFSIYLGSFLNSISRYAPLVREMLLL